jgi:hypothetical protein
MLRSLFGEPPRVDSGVLLHTNQAIALYLDLLERRPGRTPEQIFRRKRLHVTAGSFLRALDELEQSIYCSSRFYAEVTNAFAADMQPAERDSYHKHVYFYKNALIRIFAILDKLGFFLNELLILETEKMKPRFSYFTVLRRLQERQAEPELGNRLFMIKMQYAEPMKTLKHQRNLEIHLMNHEIADDLEHVRLARAGKIPLEDLASNTANMAQSFEMVCLSLRQAFDYVYANQMV